MNYQEATTQGVSVPLTKLAAGYKPGNLIGTAVFPVVTSVLSTGQIPVFTSKDAFRIYQTYRATGARSNRATIKPDSWLTYACREHDLAIPLDQAQLDELRNIPGDQALRVLFNMQDRTRQRVQWNLALELEQVIAGMIQNAVTYPAGHVAALTNTNCWDQSGSKPVTDIEAGREKIRSAIGVYPNTMIMGAVTANILKFHPQYVGMLDVNKTKIVPLPFVAEVHDIKKIHVGMSMSVDSDENLVDLWGDFFVLAYIPDSGTPDLDEPAFGYTIKPAFYPKPLPYVDIFTEEGGKLVNVRCTDNYTTSIVMAACGYLITNTKK